MASMPNFIYGMNAKSSFIVRLPFLSVHWRTEGRPPMHTWYLLLYIRPGERPGIIRCCHAEHKLQAARIFAGRLNTMMGRQAYTTHELLPAIKREDELTDQEQHWIASEPQEMLEL
jgi:hypothetical protein